MKWSMASMAERWLALRQKLHSRDEQRFYLEWVVVAVLALSTLSLVTVMQWGMAPGHVIYDQFHRWRAPLPSNDIVIIGIDDASLDELGGWPLKRKVYADLLQKLADTNNLPKAIGFDILFPDPSPYDAELAKQMRRHNTYLAVEQPRLTAVAPFVVHQPQAALIDAAKGLAHINVTFESDGFSRGAYLQERDLPHLALAVSGQSAEHYQSNGAYRRFNLVDPEIGFPIVSLADALSDGFPLTVLKDKYILIGSIAPSLGDHFPTIYSGRQGSGTPGVVLHANLLNDILRGNLIRPVPLWVQLALSLWALMSVLVALMVLSPLAEFVFAAITAVSALAVSFTLLLAADVWFDPAVCILAIALVKPAWAWRRTEMIVSFMSDRAAKLENIQRSRKTLISGGLKLRHFTSDTVLQYSRLLDKAIGVSSERLEFLNRIVSEAPTAMLVADADQRIVLVSPRMLQDIPLELLRKGQPLLPLMAFLGIHKSQDLNHLTGKDHYVSGMDATGTTRHYIFRAVQLAQTEDNALWIFALTDITEIRQFEAQREQTLQLLSHDMRTPIASIMALSRKGHVDHLSADVNPSTAAGIYRHADTLLNMMDDFIYSIKAQAHEYELIETLVDSLVDDAIYQVKDLAQSRQMRLVQSFDDEPQFIMANQRLFTRMLVNLLVNAVRYGQPQTDIHIALGHDTDTSADALSDPTALPRPMVQITISNTVGDKTQNAQPRQLASEGFGLGLVFVKTVIRKHLGEVRVDLPAMPGDTARVECRIPNCEK